MGKHYDFSFGGTKANTNRGSSFLSPMQETLDKGSEGVGIGAGDNSSDIISQPCSENRVLLVNRKQIVKDSRETVKGHYAGHSFWRLWHKNCSKYCNL